MDAAARSDLQPTPVMPRDGRDVTKRAPWRSAVVTLLAALSIVLAVAPRAARADAGSPAQQQQAHRSWPADMDRFHPASLAELPDGPDSRLQYNIERREVGGRQIYFIIPDRWNIPGGGRGTGDPHNGRAWQGGTWRGITETLDYLQHLGVTDVWISPPMGDQYHQYAAHDFLSPNPRLGTMSDLRQLSQGLRQRGMGLVLDFTPNHTASVFRYADGSENYRDQPAPIEWTQELRPKELQTEDAFHRRGTVQDWNHPDQRINGDFHDRDFGRVYLGGSTEYPPLRDLNNSNPRVQRALGQILRYWIRAVAPSGIRLDALGHWDPSLEGPLSRDITDAFREVGVHDPFVVGEDFTGDDAKLHSHIVNTERRLRVFAFNHYFREREAWHGMAPTSNIAQSMETTNRVFGDDQDFLANFIDNHDVARFTDPKSYPGHTGSGQLKVALALNAFRRGTPTTYYGTEQALPQHPDSTDPGNRVNMFPGGYHAPGREGSEFNTSSELYRAHAAFAQQRQTWRALNRGQQIVRWHEPDNGVGLLVVSRREGNQEVTYAINFSDQERSAEGIQLDHETAPAGAELVDSLNPTHSVRVQGGPGRPRINLRLPGHGVALLVRRDIYDEELARPDSLLHTGFVSPHGGAANEHPAAAGGEGAHAQHAGGGADEPHHVAAAGEGHGAAFGAPHGAAATSGAPVDAAHSQIADGPGANVALGGNEFAHPSGGGRARAGASQRIGASRLAPANRGRASMLRFTPRRAPVGYAAGRYSRMVRPTRPAIGARRSFGGSGAPRP